MQIDPTLSILILMPCLWTLTMKRQFHRRRIYPWEKVQAMEIKIKSSSCNKILKILTLLAVAFSEQDPTFSHPTTQSLNKEINQDCWIATIIVVINCRKASTSKSWIWTLSEGSIHTCKISNHVNSLGMMLWVWKWIQETQAQRSARKFRSKTIQILFQSWYHHFWRKIWKKKAQP